jgi:hypothetical protein
MRSTSVMIGVVCAKLFAGRMCADVHRLRPTRLDVNYGRTFCVNPMTHARTLTEKFALSILARDGIAAIWQLHVAAADAHQTGHPAAATAMPEIAEAAEAAWLRAEGEGVLVMGGAEATEQPTSP